MNNDPLLAHEERMRVGHLEVIDTNRGRRGRHARDGRGFVRGFVVAFGVAPSLQIKLPASLQELRRSPPVRGEERMTARGFDLLTTDERDGDNRLMLEARDDVGNRVGAGLWFRVRISRPFGDRCHQITYLDLLYRLEYGVAVCCNRVYKRLAGKAVFEARVWWRFWPFRLWPFELRPRPVPGQKTRQPTVTEVRITRIG